MHVGPAAGCKPGDRGTAINSTHLLLGEMIILIKPSLSLLRLLPHGWRSVGLRGPGG